MIDRQEIDEEISFFSKKKLIERSSPDFAFFFRNSSYPRQLTTSTPTHTTIFCGGSSPFESYKVSKVVGAS